MAKITTFMEDRPGFYDISDIYDPDNPKQSSGKNMVIPKVGSLVNNNGTIFWVSKVSPAPEYKSTLLPTVSIVTDENIGNQISVIDYGNNVFNIYVDDRNSPIRLKPDSRLIVYGTVEYYRLVMNKGKSNERIVSRHYDTDGKYISSNIPMKMVTSKSSSSSGVYYPTGCHTLDTIPNGTLLTMEIFNQHGALVATVTTFANSSYILNESIGYNPQISKLKLKATQVRENGEFFLYENQDPDSLNIQAYLVYTDGTEIQVNVDGRRCIIYGLEEFNASWPGLRQTILVKYNLSADETPVAGLTTTSFISVEQDIVVVSTQVGSGVKISPIPYWNNTAASYAFEYFIYNKDRSASKHITPLVTVVKNTFNGITYGVFQAFTISVDLKKIYPKEYASESIYQQTIIVKLRPQAAYDKYLLKDAINSPVTYGVDEPKNKRPVLHYDSDVDKYFIPTSLFGTKEDFIRNFYERATPTYDPALEAGPPAPTHFLLRDIRSGAMLNSNIIPVKDYASEINITGLPVGRFVNSTILIEFIHYIDATNQLICHGSPVDVHKSKTGYAGN